MVSRYKPKRLSTKRKKINGYIVDETQIKVGSQCIWLWVAIEPKHREILQIDVKVKSCCSGVFIAYLVKRLKVWKVFG